MLIETPFLMFMIAKMLKKNHADSCSDGKLIYFVRLFYKSEAFRDNKINYIGIKKKES